MRTVERLRRILRKSVFYVSVGGQIEDKTNGGRYKDVQGNKLRLLTLCKYFRCRALILNGVYEDVNAKTFTAVNVIENKGTAEGQSFCAEEVLP